MNRRDLVKMFALSPFGALFGFGRGAKADSVDESDRLLGELLDKAESESEWTGLVKRVNIRIRKGNPDVIVTEHWMGRVSFDQIQNDPHFGRFEGGPIHHNDYPNGDDLAAQRCYQTVRDSAVKMGGLTEYKMCEIVLGNEVKVLAVNCQSGVRNFPTIKMKLGIWDQ